MCDGDLVVAVQRSGPIEFVDSSDTGHTKAIELDGPEGAQAGRPNDTCPELGSTNYFLVTDCRTLKEEAVDNCYYIREMSI
jgi:hypothetical protein